MEIAWSDIEAIVPSKESGYRPFISSLVLNIEMKESVALTYPYGRRPSLRIPNVLISVSYSDIVRAISQYTPVTLIHADWYAP